MLFVFSTAVTRLGYWIDSFINFMNLCLAAPVITPAFFISKAHRHILYSKADVISGNSSLSMSWSLFFLNSRLNCLFLSMDSFVRTRFLLTSVNCLRKLLTWVACSSVRVYISESNFTGISLVVVSKSTTLALLSSSVSNRLIPVFKS